MKGLEKFQDKNFEIYKKQLACDAEEAKRFDWDGTSALTVSMDQGPDVP